ncbi:MAG TPA: FAD-dependent oxidoreductase [Gemmatimonadaceae bacterium]|nr:FAD-dependent oxidoreductase [Gemmatimonadaceae bacterium]
MTMSARVVVIGGGFAGVAAAASLASRGADVVLLDDRRTLGGRARSDELEGMTIDTGAQLVSTMYTRTLALLDADAPARAAVDAMAGAMADAAQRAPALHRVAGRDAYVRDGTRHPIQFGSIRSLLAFRGLGTWEKLGLARHLMPMLAAHRAALDAAAARIPPALDAQRARAYVSAHVSERAADVLVEPPLNGFYAMRGDEASLAFFLMLGRYGSEGDVLAPVGGWSRALARALRGARHEPAVTVRALARDGAALVVHADDRTWRADAVVVATGPRTAGALLAPLVPEHAALLRWLGEVPMRATWTLALALDTTPPRDAFGVFHDGRDARVVSACAVAGANMTAPPADRDVVLAWPTPDAAQVLAGASAERIASAMLPDVESLVPEVRGHVVRARVYRFAEGTPLAHPDFAADRERARALVDALPPELALAGDYLAAPLIEGAVASGWRAADRIAAAPSSR